MFESENEPYSSNMKQGRVDVGFEFEVVFDFDFLQFPCVDAFAARQKMEKEGSMFERSEFSSLPIF